MYSAIVTALLLAQPCRDGVCPPRAEPAHPSVVRVINDNGRERTMGSGTLVFKDAERAVVISCGHLFAEYTGRVSVTFPGGEGFAARVLEVDRRADLSALLIASPSAPAAMVASELPRVGDPLISAGYGPDGQYATNRGRALGYVSLDGQSRDVIELSGSARQGDSGGPIWNARGELAGVLIGTDGRRVAGVHCGKVREFLQRHAAKPQAEGTPKVEFGDIDARLAALEASQTILNNQLAATLRKSGAPCQCDPNLSDRLARLEASRLDPPTAGAVPRVPAGAAPSGSGPSWDHSPRGGGQSPIPPRAPEMGTDPSGPSWFVETFLKTKLVAVLVGFGLPSGIAGIVAWLLLRRAKKRLKAIVIHNQSPPSPQIVERERQFVEVQVPTDRLGALEWAIDEYVKRNPGARPTVETIEAYAKQFQAATKRG